jgi:predicted transcriptional regulator
MNLTTWMMGVCAGGQVVLSIWFAVSAFSLVRSQKKQLEIIGKAIADVEKFTEQYKKEIRRIAQRMSEISKSGDRNGN